MTGVTKSIGRCRVRSVIERIAGRFLFEEQRRNKDENSVVRSFYL